MDDCMIRNHRDAWYTTEPRCPHCHGPMTDVIADVESGLDFCSEDCASDYEEPGPYIPTDADYDALLECEDDA